MLQSGSLAAKNSSDCGWIINKLTGAECSRWEPWEDCLFRTTSVPGPPVVSAWPSALEFLFFLKAARLIRTLLT